MSDTHSERNPVETLAEEFVERYRRGERPSLTEYTRRHPELADEIRDLFPTLVMMEQVRPAGTHEAATSGGRPAAAAGPVPPRLGDYRLLREVGRGGMGIVYEAEQESLGRHVALKVLPANTLLDAGRLERFRREAKAAARLHHTNIVPVFGVGEDAGLHYYVMQFIQGQGLDQVLEELKRLRKPPKGAPAAPAAPETGGCARNASAAEVAGALLTGRFTVGPGAPAAAEGTSAGLPSTLVTVPAAADSSAPVRLPGQPEHSTLSESGRSYCNSVARIGIQVAEALDQAHAQGVLHRDIKPSNLLLDTHGTVWVTDFGLAKASDSDSLTQTGDIVGTLRYMAPERFGGQADPRSDLYGLGVTLYELLTLHPAFEDADRNRLLQRVLHDEPPRPRQLNPEVPRDLETVVLKAIAKEPRHRYASAAELAEDLRRFLADRPIKARRVSALEHLWRWARRSPALAAVSGLTLASLLLTVGVSIAFGVYQYHVAARLDAVRKEADRLVLQSGLDRATALCEQGHIDRGMLWWADSLVKAERLGDADAERLIRTNLASWQQHLHALQGCLEHGDEVRAVAFAPTGRLAATGSADGTAQLWESSTGAKVVGPLTHPGPVSAVQFSPDAQVLLTVSGNRAFLWDVATGTRLRGLTLASRAEITAVAFRPRGTAVLLGGADGTGELREPGSGRLLGVPLRHGDLIHAAAFSPDGQLLLTGSADGTARLWHAGTGSAVDVPVLRHAPAVRAVAFRPDGEALLTGSADGTAQVWRTATGTKLGPPLPHNARVNAVRFTPDGRTIITASEGWNACLWETGTGVLRAKLPHQGPVRGLALSPDGRTLLTGSLDGKARLWEVASGKLLGAPLSHPGEVRTVAFSPDERCPRILTAGNEPAARLWKPAPPPKPPTRLDQPGWPFAMAFSPDGRLLAMPGEGHGVQVWDVDRKEKRGHLPDPEAQVVAFGPEGGVVATGGEDRHVRLWRVAGGGPIGTPLEHPAKVTAIAFAPDGRTLLIGTKAGTVTHWDVAGGRRLQEFSPHKGPVWSMAWSPDGHRFATGSADHTARLIDPATGAIGPTLRHQGQVWSVAFRPPDGEAVLTASEDQTGRLWEVPSGQPLGAPFRADGPVRTAAFSRDGQVMVLGGSEGFARLWDVATRRPLAAPVLDADPARGPVLAAAMAADGSWVAVAEDKTIRRWSPPAPVAGTGEQVVLWAQILTGMELESGAAVVLDAPVWRQRLRQLPWALQRSSGKRQAGEAR
jgi:WD40 repeat protein/serine/threonine protein kinase